MIEEDLQPLLQKAFFYLKFRPRTKGELENYLLKKIKTTHWSSDDVKRIIVHLEELEFIDDKKFIQWFVEQRSLLKPKSEFALKRELFQHGVNKSMIDEYFSANPLDEEDLAFKTLQNRWQRFQRLNKMERFKKASQFLMRRGFGFDIVKKTIEKLEN